MKKFVYLLSALLSIVSLCTAFYFTSSRGSVYAQTSESASRVSRTVGSTPAKPSSSTSSAEFTAAAARNAQLRRSLSWVFGGRSQSGWEIYVPLITNTIAVDAEAGSPEFAAALSKWQQKNGIASTGILDADTLQALIRFWQGQRLGRSSPPADGSLVSAPITDFFDPITRSRLASA